MRVLFASSEVFPLAKTGGLADVSAALPRALADLGVDMRLVLPGYPKAIAAATQKSVQAEFGDFMNSGPARLIAARLPDNGLPVWLLDCPKYFARPGGLYRDTSGKDWPDNAERFAFFSHVAARLALGQIFPDWRADIVHANDWHTGLLPLILQAEGNVRPATVFTLHNVAYQGLCPADHLPQLGIPSEAFTPDGLEFYGQISFLKAGIRYSDRLTTVSPSYAREILTPEFGCGLDGTLRQRADRLTGILNGADYRIWDPSADPYLPANYDPRDLTGKRLCKRSLQAEMDLEPDSDTPLLIFLNRITHQKMADTLADALPAIIERGVQIAMLGDGDRWLEDRLAAAAQLYPRRAAIRIGYEEPLAHRLQAGGDILLFPARFEPCGLSQLYAMRYGTLPIVRATGGLGDTVVDVTDETLRLGTATGFAFESPNADELVGCIDRALAIYRQPLAWRRIQQQAMTREFSWDAPAREYLDLYRSLAPKAAVPDPLPAVDPLPTAGQLLARAAE